MSRIKIKNSLNLMPMSIDKTRAKKKKESRKKHEMSFEEKLAKFLVESEERLFDLRKNLEAKRGRKKK